MQGTLDHASPTWTQIAFYVLASFVGGGGAATLLGIWINRRKIPAEIHKTAAETDKSKAEARKIHVEADVELNAIIERLHIRIDQMQLGVDEIREERNELKMRVDMQAIELEMRDKQVDKLTAVIKANGIKLSDFDQPKQ